MHRLLAVAVLLPALLLVRDLPPQDRVTLVKVADVPAYCEGIVFDRAGAAYVSVTLRGTIYKIAPAGEPVVWARTDAPNGHRVLPDGTHLVADRVAVLHLDANGGRLAPASTSADGKPLKGPNDLALDPGRGFYFTDPGPSSAKNPVGTVDYVDGAGVTRVVAGGLAFSNGIVLRPDGRTLLVGESGHNRILSYDVVSPGTLGARRVFAVLPEKTGDQIDNAPDGMALDEDGNLFVAHYGMRTVQALDPRGRLVRSYPAGNLTASNVAFGGPHMDQLFVTGAVADEKTSPGALWRLDLTGVRGRRLVP